MDIAKLRQLIRQPEGVKLEFKRELYKFDPSKPKYDPQWHEFMKDLIALANGNLGTAHEEAYLIIGVDDNIVLADELDANSGKRELYDIGETDKALGETNKVIRKRIIDKLGNICEPPFQNLIYETKSLDGKKLIVITIPPSNSLYRLKNPLKPKSSENSPGYKIGDVLLRLEDGERIYVSTNIKLEERLQFEKENWQKSPIYRNLTNPEYIENKIKFNQLESLIKQYVQHIADDNPLERQYILRLLLETLKLAEKPLSSDFKQLSSQLIGRLFFHVDPDIRRLLNEFRQWKTDQSEAWLEPVSSSLEPPIAFELKTLTRHSSKPVEVLVVDSSSNSFISASSNSSINVWNLSQDKIVDPIFRLKDCEFSKIIVESNDNHQKLIFSIDNTVFAWSIETKQLVSEFKHDGAVNSIAITPDNDLISASDDCKLRVWSLMSESNEEPLTVFKRSDPITDVIVTSDRKYVLFSFDTFIEIWNQTSNTFDKISAHDTTINNLYLFPDQSKFLSLSKDDDTLKIWDIENKILLQERLSCHIKKLAVSLDNQLIFFIDEVNGDLIVWNWQFERLSSSWFEGLDENVDPFKNRNVVNDFVLAPNGKWLITASTNKTIQIWDIANRQLIKEKNLEFDIPVAISVTPDGNRLIVALDNKSLEIWDLLDSQFLNTSTIHTKEIYSVQVVRDENNKGLAISVSKDASLKLWEVNNGCYSKTFKPDVLNQLGDSDEWISAYTTDSQRLIFASGKDGALATQDLSSNSTQKALEGHLKRINKIIIIPGTNYAVSASEDEISEADTASSNLIVWDFEIGVVYKHLVGHLSGVDTISINSKKKILVSASIDKTLIWSLETFDLLYTFSGQSEFIKRIAEYIKIFPARKYSACESGEKDLNLWDLSSGKLLFTLPDRKDVVTTIAVTNDIKKLITTSDNNYLEFWNVQKNEKEPSHFSASGHSDTINSVITTRCNQYAISASDDRTIKVWSISDGSLITTFTGESEMTACSVLDDDLIIVAGEKSGRIHFLKLQGI